MAELPTSRASSPINAALAIPTERLNIKDPGDPIDSFNRTSEIGRNLINDLVIQPAQNKMNRETHEQNKKLTDVKIKQAEQDLQNSQASAEAQREYLAGFGSSPATGGSVVPAPPPGVDPIEWRKAWTGILAEEQSPETQRQLASKAEQEATTAGFALRDVDEAINRLESSSDNPIVRLGKAFVPETSEYEMKKAIQSLQGTIAIDQLLNIKQQGAGLGQVPQSQLNMLSVLLGTLDLGLKKETLRGKLEDIKTQYSDLLSKMTPEDRALVGVAVRELDKVETSREEAAVSNPAEGLPVVNSLSDYNKLNLKPGDRYIYNGEIAVVQ